MEDFIFTELVVHFEKKDISIAMFPFLGQAAMNGSLNALVGRDELVGFLNTLPGAESKERVKRELTQGKTGEEALMNMPDHSPQLWFSPDDGWKVAARIKAALTNPTSVKKAGLASILTEVKEEVEWLMVAFEYASDNNSRFWLDLDECSDPPPTLVQWVKSQFTEMAVWLREILDEVGFDSMEGPK